ncbi:hypothetical protein MicvaDRAFT_4068 [Microcoleus vaginatus FGP-2]|nr:hypothetical protein MicvaDRAFT_4068 [Microcoleus vaginatus FGP-2]
MGVYLGLFAVSNLCFFSNFGAILGSFLGLLLKRMRFNFPSGKHKVNADKANTIGVYLR